jgi:hypothetical protein
MHVWIVVQFAELLARHVVALLRVALEVDDTQPQKAVSQATYAAHAEGLNGSTAGAAGHTAAEAIVATSAMLAIVRRTRIVLG